MNPLTVTWAPNIFTEIGWNNFQGLIKSGLPNILGSADGRVHRRLTRDALIEMGEPFQPFIYGQYNYPVKIAVENNISVMMYGENGEVEYGGSDETKYIPTFDSLYERRVYLEDGYEKVLKNIDVDDSKLHFFRFPEESELKNIILTHWSYFDPWDSYRNYVVAKEHCGLKEKEFSNTGTFTNFAQNDQAFYAIHTYMMYLKFGFGRATQDAGIEIRRGSMDRDQALNLVRLYDNSYPEEFLHTYLDYYQMTQDEFDSTIDKWANKNLFEKINDRWTPKFRVGEPFSLCE